MPGLLQIKRVEDCMEWLEAVADKYTSSQSVGWLIDQLGELCKAMPFVNNQMAIAKYVLNGNKIKAYNSLVGSSVANESYFAPSLAKDYIASKVREDQYNYDICERASRTIVHTVEALRTAISALKEEVKMQSYANQQNANHGQ